MVKLSIMFRNVGRAVRMLVVGKRKGVRIELCAEYAERLRRSTGVCCNPILRVTGLSFTVHRSFQNSNAVQKIVARAVCGHHANVSEDGCNSCVDKTLEGVDPERRKPSSQD